MYFQDAEAALIVYDTTFRESFDSAKNWINDLKANANIPDILIAVVGNKCDMAEDMKVSIEDARRLGEDEKA